MDIGELTLKQNSDGSFGRFHSMSIDGSITTEKALRWFFFKNLDKDVPVVKKCLDYVRDCLHKDIIIPDRREKVINWDVFEELMFSAWLTAFKVDDVKVTSIQLIWKNIIEKSIIEYKFNIEEYKLQYRLLFGKKGVREIDPSSFYMVCLLSNKLNPMAKIAYFHYIMENGIYYIFNKNLYIVPPVFDSKSTIYYLIAIKLISVFAIPDNELNFIRNWLNSNKSKEGNWEMNNLKPDGIIFPRSGNWRKQENKLLDLNNFINEVLSIL